MGISRRSIRLRSNLCPPLKIVIFFCIFADSKFVKTYDELVQILDAVLSYKKSIFFVCNMIMFYLVCTTYISCHERILYSYDQNICNRKEWNSGIYFILFP